MPSHQSLRCALGTLSDELGPRQIWQAQMRHLTSKSLLSTWSEMSGDYHNSRSPFAVRRSPSQSERQVVAEWIM